MRNEITKQRNGCVYPFPLNHIQNWRKQRTVRRQLNVAESLNIKLEEVVENVDKLCQSLSMKLDDKLYFYGDEYVFKSRVNKMYNVSFFRPTELDALVFGHLFSIFTMTLPNNVLAETINKYRNLTIFCKNVEAKYFKKPASTVKKAV